MHLKSIILYLLLSCSLCVLAENNYHNITINGKDIDKKVNQITFDGDKIFFHWSDGSTSREASKVIMDISDSSNINDIKIFSIGGFQGSDLIIDGLNPNQNLFIYDIYGKIMMRTIAIAARADLKINKLNTGIYLLKANDAVIKFVKK